MNWAAAAAAAAPVLLMALSVGKRPGKGEGDIPLPDVTVTSMISEADDNDESESVDAGVRSSCLAPAAGVTQGSFGSRPDVKSMPDFNGDGVSIISIFILSSSPTSWSRLAHILLSSFLRQSTTEASFLRPSTTEACIMRPGGTTRVEHAWASSVIS